MLPNFLVIGAAKSATTSLCALLAKHPEVYFCPSKEISFFNRDDLYEGKGMSLYESIFNDASGYKAVGEGSIQYSRSALFPHTAARIAKHLPTARIVYMVRHPIDRIESHYSQRLNNGETILPFLEDLRRFPAHYIDTSDYWKQINIYRQYYSDDQILVLFFDDFKNDPDAILRKCFQFLEVDSDVKIDRTRNVKNPSSKHQQDTKILSILKGMPLFDQIRSSLPQSVRSKVRGSLRTPVKQTARWDAATLNWVVEELQSNCDTFLKFYGKSEGYWNFESDRVHAQSEAEAGRVEVDS